MQLITLSALTTLVALSAANPLLAPVGGNTTWGDCATSQQFHCQHAEGQKNITCTSSVDDFKFAINQFSFRRFFRASWSEDACCAKAGPLPGLIKCKVLTNGKRIYGSDLRTGMPFRKATKGSTPTPEEDSSSDERVHGATAAQDELSRSSLTSGSSSDAETFAKRQIHEPSSDSFSDSSSDSGSDSDHPIKDLGEQAVHAFELEAQKLERDVELAKAALQAALEKQLARFEKWAVETKQEAEQKEDKMEAAIKEKIVKVQTWAAVLALETKSRAAEQEKLIKKELAAFALWAKTLGHKNDSI